MKIWLVKGTNIDGDKDVVGIYSSEVKAKTAKDLCCVQQPRGHFWVDGPYEVDANTNASYY